MLNDCKSVIRATGPDHDITRIKHLLDSNAHQRGGDEVTYFMNIIDKFLDGSMGLRWRSEETEDDIIWAGSLDWEPPSEFVKEMSVRFPEVTFQMMFTNECADSSATYEFKSGESRLLHGRGEGFECCGPEPEPIGVGCTDFPDCFSPRGPSIESVEKFEARRESGQNLGDDPDAELRRDELTLEAVGLDGEKTFVNLTPDEEHGCYLPLEFFEEFLRLRDGQSASKTGSAWFYSAPHDREPCIYRASIDGHDLRIEVQVTTETLVRRATFALYSRGDEH